MAVPDDAAVLKSIASVPSAEDVDDETLTPTESPSFAPTCTDLPENDPSNSFVPLKSKPDATSSMPETSPFARVCKLDRSAADNVASAACTASERKSCRLERMFCNPPSATPVKEDAFEMFKDACSKPRAALESELSALRRSEWLAVPSPRLLPVESRLRLDDSRLFA